MTTWLWQLAAFLSFLPQQRPSSISASAAWERSMSQLSSILHTAGHTASHWNDVLRAAADHYGTVMLDTASHYALAATHAVYTHTTPATACLGLALALSAFAYGSLRRYTVVALLPVCVAAVMAVGIGLGRPLPMAPPPGDYQVLGADIQVDVAIYVLLKADGDAVYYRLPYTTQQANALQAAKDGGGGVKAKVDGEGGVAYDGEPPVSGSESKVPEAPAYRLLGG